MNAKDERKTPPVRSRAYRCLARFAKNYHSILPDTDYFDSEYAQKEYPIQLDYDEYLIGVYENMFGEKIFDIPPGIKIWPNIVITNQSLNLYSDSQYEKIYFKDIIRVDGPENKQDDLVLHIHLSGKIIDLAILYTYEENGKLKDVFSWWQFLGSFC